jgi:type IV secretory pathway VirB3-like protein
MKLNALIGALAAILVLVLSAAPSGARIASPIYFFRQVGVLQQPRIRPSAVSFVADGTENVTGLHWRGWGTGVARADGTDHIVQCVPNCAEGSTTLVPAHITLWQPGRFRGGREMYLCYHLYYTVKTTARGQRGCLPQHAAL